MCRFPFLLLLCAFAHAVPAKTAVKPGVVVEKIDKEFEAARVGMQKGDVLLSWSRGRAKGDIETPFDLYDVQFEENPKGPVTISGVRHGKPYHWVLTYDWWGLNV